MFGVFAIDEILCYRWDPSLSRNPVPRFPHFMPPWKQENKIINCRQEENRKLSSSLTAATERDSGVSEDESYIEIDLVHKLQVFFFEIFNLWKSNILHLFSRAQWKNNASNWETLTRSWAMWRSQYLCNCSWFLHQWFNMIIIDHSWSTTIILYSTWPLIW